MSKRHKKVQVVVFATHQNKIYLLRLQTNKKRGHFWQNITGSVDAEESFKDAAVRETSEETNISAKKESFIKLDLEYEFHDQWQRDVKEKCFLLKLDHREDVIIDSKEHSHYEWKLVDNVTEKDFRFPSNYEVFQEGLKFIG